MWRGGMVGRVIVEGGFVGRVGGGSLAGRDSASWRGVYILCGGAGCRWCVGTRLVGRGGGGKCVRSGGGGIGWAEDVGAGGVLRCDPGRSGARMSSACSMVGR